jgi:two-component system LytT family response regulator/two-component system response regulator AlgR
MTGLRVAVAEDEPLNRRRLVRLLTEAGCAVTGVFEDGASLLDWLRGGPDVDALFCDIRMPGPSGLEVMRALPRPLPTVFVTAFADHAVEAFEVAAADFLLKPVSEKRLRACLTRLATAGPERPPSAVPARPPRRFAVKAGDGLVFLDLAKTTHFELADGLVWAHAGGRFRTPWTSLSEAEASLGDAGLLRIHRHLLVRVDAILGLRPAEGDRVRVTLPGGVILEASRPMTPRLKARLGIS